MKILLTADAVGGVWTYAVELAGSLECEVVVACLGPAPTVEQRRDLDAELHVYECALEWMDDPWDDVERSGSWLLELAERVRPDVVHLNGYAHASLPWRAPVVVVGHSDVLSWFHHVRRSDAPPEWERYREEVERGLDAAALVVAPTRAVLRDLERHYRFGAERRVIPNGRSPVAPRAKEPFVLAAGRAWDEAKNLEAVRELELSWPLRAADGTLARAEVEELMGRASVFVSLASYEPFGLAPLEAASAGCALVLSEIDSFREVWGDAAAYGADQVERVIGDGVLRAELAARARARAAEYTTSRMAASYADAYEQVTVCYLERAPA